MENQEHQQHIDTLIGCYCRLNNGAKAELRKLKDYKDVPLEAPFAFYPVREQYHAEIKKHYSQNVEKKRWSYGETVIAALLLFWRDRRANEDQLKSIQQKLGSLFVRDRKVKINRFKRLMQAEKLDEGFHALRPILLLFRHDDVNWGEVASLISAWKQNEDDNPQFLYICKKKLADAYYPFYEFNSNQ